MKQILCCLLASLVSAAGMLGQENPLKKSARGDWAKYLVTSKNATEPLLSYKDQQRWRAVTNAGDEFVRIDNYIMFGERRSGGGGTISYFKDPYEPTPGILKGAKINVVSTSKEKVTIAGTQYECTKVVRKVDQPLNEAAMETSWIGTSTLWLCDKIPLGLAKMENVFQTQMTKSDPPQKVTESWIVVESGFKNWKEN